MIGQHELFRKLTNLTSLPGSILLVGERGSEQKELCVELAKYFNLNLINMTDNINTEYIDLIYDSHTPTLYMIDLLEVSIKEQNVLLKLFEEPSYYAHIVLFAESDTAALETIITRSYSLRMGHYPESTLRSLIEVSENEDLILKVCKTPGQVELANVSDVKGIFDLCHKMVSSMHKAIYPNALSISNKINFKDELEKYDLFLFIKILKYVMLELSCNYDMYSKLSTLDQYIWQMTNKKSYFENFITNLWEFSRS